MIVEIDYDRLRWQHAGSGEPWLNLAGGHGLEAFCEDVVHLADKLDLAAIRGTAPLAIRAAEPAMVYIKALGKEVTFGNDALPINMRTTSGEGEEILASPIRFVVEADRGPIGFQNTTPALAETSATKVVFSSQSKAGDILVLDTSARMEYDGYGFYQVTLRALRDVAIKDIRLEIPYRKKIATYLMGFSSGEGGYRRSEVKWSWNERPGNNRVCIGDVDAGLRCKLRGPAALEESNPITNERGGIPVGWSNEGRGGATVTEDGQIVWVRAMPRGLFEGQPTGIRLGKMDPFRRGSYSNKGGRQEARYDDLLVLGPPQDAP